MDKVCEVCQKPYTSKEGKQKACSKECGDILRSRTNKLRAAGVNLEKPRQIHLREEDLPPPEVLPAAYLKRCHDFWAELVGGSGDPRKRLI